MTPLPVRDLVERLTLGRSRGAGLVRPDEEAWIARWTALDGPAALLFARLAGRRASVFRVPELSAAGVDDVPGAVARLTEAGVLDPDVPWSERAQHAPRAVLADGCRRLGLARSGRRDVLVARLGDAEGWDEAPWVAVAHADLLLRVSRWATLELFPNPSRPVLARMGTWRFVDHPVTGGRLLPDRAAWDAWEDLVARLDTLTPDEALDALAWPAWPPAGLDVRGALVRRVREAAAEAVRAGEGTRARAWWSRLWAIRPRPADRVAWARSLERDGDPDGALAALLEAYEGAEGVDRLVLARPGRRLCRALGRTWVPDPPLRRPRVRTLQLDRVASDGPRPRYGVDRDLVEDAVVRRLTEAGRVAVGGEARLWRTIVVLLLSEAAFLPVDGQLPVPRLTGPLDLGTPAFAARRPAAVQQVVDEVASGAAATRLADAWARLADHQIRGVDTTGLDGDAVVDLVEAMGARLLGLLRPFLVHGWRAFRGVPDLTVWPGAEVRVPGLHPARLPPGPLFVEVKGETDTLRDGQRVWLDRLGALGEVWRVVAA